MPGQAFCESMLVVAETDYVRLVRLETAVGIGFVADLYDIGDCERVNVIAAFGFRIVWRPSFQPHDVAIRRDDDDEAVALRSGLREVGGVPGMDDVERAERDHGDGLAFLRCAHEGGRNARRRASGMQYKMILNGSHSFGTQNFEKC